MPQDLNDRLQQAVAVATTNEDAEKRKREIAKAEEREKRALKEALDTKWEKVCFPLLREAVDKLNENFQTKSLEMKIEAPRHGYSHRVELRLRSLIPGKELWGHISLSRSTLDVHYHRIAARPTHDRNTYPAGYFSEPLEGFDENSAMSCVINMLETFNGTENS